jgi:acetoin utilization deacetylase AcuC-like enzyme
MTMQTFFHPEQLLHHPNSYLSRGQMRPAQEVPERASRLVAAVKSLDFEIREPADSGMAGIAAVHDMNYLRFLEEAYAEWKQMPDDWGDEVMSNIYVREPNPLRGILAKAARYLADGSCPVGQFTWRAAYWSAQARLRLRPRSTAAPMRRMRYAVRPATTRASMRRAASAT